MHSQVPLYVLCLLMLWHKVFCDDDDFEGPLLQTKPDGSLYTTAELVEQHNYTCEAHKVTTADGYVLTVYRVSPPPSTPPHQSRSPVLLQHGFMMTSDMWITDPGALAFKLVDAGFDVWLSNVRGNAYSRSHNTLKPEQKEFWNFSWHEMGTQDIPAVVDYILKQSDQKSKRIHYIGFCMGTSIGLVTASTISDMNKKLWSLILFAPLAFPGKMKNMVGPDGMVEAMVANMVEEYKKKNKQEIFPRRDLCTNDTNDSNQLTCKDMDESVKDMCDAHIEMAYETMGPNIMGGTSLKTMDHSYQMAKYGELRHYNMSSKEENQKAYGSDEPPKYSDKFGSIKVPVLMWSGKGDQFMTFEDSDSLAAALPSVVANNKIDEACFDHAAFLFPLKKSCLPFREQLYNNCIEAMQKLEKK